MLCDTRIVAINSLRFEKHCDGAHALLLSLDTSDYRIYRKSTAMGVSKLLDYNRRFPIWSQIVHHLSHIMRPPDEDTLSGGQTVAWTFGIDSCREVNIRRHILLKRSIAVARILISVIFEMEFFQGTTEDCYTVAKYLATWVVPLRVKQRILLRSTVEFSSYVGARC